MLSTAINGASRTRIASLNSDIRQGDVSWLLDYLIEKRLLECDQSELYWATVDGVKFLEIHFHMERILRASRALV